MITLRDNQKRFDAEVKDAMRRHRRICAVAPTGFGKRVWCCDAMCRVVEKGKRAMLVTDRQILVRQARNECREHSIPYGVVMGAEPTNEEAPIQICSIQTLQRREWRDNPQADVIFVDECHKASATYLELFDQYPESFVIGLTATPVGANDKLLIPMFDTVIEPVKNTELIENKWLLPTRVICPCEPNVKGVTITSSTGEYSGTQAGERVEQMYVHANIWKHWKPFSDQQTIVFVPRLKFARFIVDEFVKRGHAAEIIEAATSLDERDGIFDRFANRETRVIVSVDVLKEGFDSPIASVALDLQPNAKLRTWWQKVGRVKRPYEGQDHAVLLDFAGNYWRLDTHPDEDPDWPSNADETTADVREKKREKQAPEPWECPACCMTLAFWQRLKDGICPNCGYKLQKAKRRVLMGNGEMEVISARKRRKRKANSEVDKWFRCLYPAVNGGHKLNLARALFKRSMGYWPDHDRLPYCPEPRDPAWARKAADVFPNLSKRRKR